MASTNTRLFRLVSSRWLGSRVESSEGQIDGPEPARLAGEETLPSNERLAKLAATLKSGVNRVRLSSRYLVPAQKKLSVPAYASESGQSLEDAMSEYNESVKQYYGVQLTNPDVEAIISQNTIVETGVAKVENLSNLSRKVQIAQAKKLRISMNELNQRMKAITVNVMAPGISYVSRLTRIREMCEYTKQHPASRTVAIRLGVIPFLLSLESKLKRRPLAETKQLLGVIRESLAVLGYSPSLKTKGIRVLSIDGGGTRGLVAIETLKQLEIICGAPIHELFDYICGVSTGGLLAVLVGSMRMPLDQCEAVYRDCSQRVFSRRTLAGMADLITRHSYYDMSVWESILKEELGETHTLTSGWRAGPIPRVGLVSTLMGEIPCNFVFRNYNHHPSEPSQYPGTCTAKTWEAIRASSAAPGYFEEFKLGDAVHQDGGVLNNNPTAIAIHEARLLWPGEEIQCIVSLGTGRYEPASDNLVQDLTSLKDKVGAFIHSATNTEGVHTVLHDLLEPKTYYRFNPYLSQDFTLNEIKEERLNQMQFETQLYLRRNSDKLNKVGSQLRLQRTRSTKMVDWARGTYQSLSQSSV